MNRSQQFLKTATVSLLIVYLFFSNLTTAQDKLYHNTFPLCDVVLNEGPFKHARDLNIHTLLEYNVDRLLAPYRKEAGLIPRDSSYSNWEGLDGHIGGHYLSAMAMNYAATGNEECKRRMDYMISELKECQEANAKNNPEWGTGYVGGVPNSDEIWSKFQKGNLSSFYRAWVPWYNVHKMYAGLRDAWLYGGSQEAHDIFLKFCDWGIAITSGFSDGQMEAMLGTEHGGMNEVFADAWQMAGDKKYLIAARRFSHKEILNPLSEGIDNLDNKHANTQVPKAVGFERIAELSGDEKYARAGDFFWETVTKNRSLVFGGNSRREHFPAASACSDYVNDVEGPESCNTYNMLKLTEDLFRTHPKAEYADYYERAVYNHILSTQHPDHGGYVYFTPARPRHYRVYSAPNKAMWCCVGSGMENHGKYNEFIYTHSNDSLFVNLFVASELNWKGKGVTVKQQTSFPFDEKTKLTITNGEATFSMMIRYPGWVARGALEISVNGEPIALNSEPSSYVAIKRLWKKGDVIEVNLPMHTRLVQLPNVPNYFAFMHGPVVLAAKTGKEKLPGLIADDSRWGHIAHGERLPIDKAPIIIGNSLDEIPGKLQPVKNKPLHYTMESLKMINGHKLELEPFWKIHDARYMMYWMVLPENGYQAYLDSIAGEEAKMLELERRTIDYVATGEQQPEADHFMESERSGKGANLNEFYRDASNGGFFSYRLATKGKTNVALRVRYWGYEWGSRKFDILIDDKKLVTEDNTGRWYQSQFQDVVYPIPETMVKGKDYIRIKFQALPQSTAGGVYYIRLLNANQP